MFPEGSWQMAPWCQDRSAFSWFQHGVYVRLESRPGKTETGTFSGLEELLDRAAPVVLELGSGPFRDDLGFRRSIISRVSAKKNDVSNFHT